MEPETTLTEEQLIRIEAISSRIEDEMLRTAFIKAMGAVMEKEAKTKRKRSRCTGNEYWVE